MTTQELEEQIETLCKERDEKTAKEREQAIPQAFIDARINQINLEYRGRIELLERRRKYLIEGASVNNMGPWYRKWWMYYIGYPLLTGLFLLALPIYFASQDTNKISAINRDSPSINVQSSTLNQSPIFQNTGPISVNNSLLSPYTEVAKLNYIGLPHNIQAKGGIEISTDISRTISSFIKVESDATLTITCTPSSTWAYQNVVDMIPKYPYTYYYLGFCLKINGVASSTWKSIMRPAYDILQITTQIPEHDPTQDTLFKELKTFF